MHTICGLCAGNLKEMAVKVEFSSQIDCLCFKYIKLGKVRYISEYIILIVNHLISKLGQLTSRYNHAQYF